MTQTIICAEIGINHNSDINIAKELIEKAAWAGADYVKFQKREPELAVPKDQWDVMREVPWSNEPVRYIDYKRRMEFDFDQLRDLASHARQHGIGMFLSVWDLPSLRIAASFAFDMVKIPSAKLTDEELVRGAIKLAIKQPCDLVLSTGMSTAEEVEEGLGWILDEWNQSWPRPSAEGKPWPHVWILHCHSAYPAPSKELNLGVIPILWGDAQLRLGEIPHSIGYSGHEWGIQPTVWSVALGARMIERHITLDRTMWGTDQSASVEPLAFAKMVSYVRSLEAALGDGVKRVWDSELPARAKLRGDG